MADNFCLYRWPNMALSSQEFLKIGEVMYQLIQLTSILFFFGMLYILYIDLQVDLCSYLHIW